MNALTTAPAAIAVVRTLPELLAAAAQADPDAVAVQSGDVALTYDELDRWSNRLARVLIRMGARAGGEVAVALPASVESVVAMWAVVKAGGRYTPVATEASAEVTAFPASTSAPFGITTKSNREGLADSIDWLLLDDRSTLRKYMTVSDDALTDHDRISAAA